jgi:hypothetical protein
MEELGSIDSARGPRAQRKYSVYKANKRGNGSAMQFDFNPNRESVFVEASVQKGEQEFDWNNKIIFKLGASDLSKLLVVLEGKSKLVDLFHDPGKSPFAQEKMAAGVAAGAKTVKNASFNLAKGDYGFFAKLSQQYADSSVRAISVSISEDEAVALRVLFSKAIEAIYKW